MRRMSDQPKDLRPREKLQRRGASSLSDYELIMAIIGSGNSAAGVTEIAKDVLKLLKDKGSNLTYDDLLRIKALGPAKATQFMAAYELWRRRFEVSNQSTIDRITDAVELLSDIATKNQENLVCITLDGANRVINKRTVTIGTLNSSMVHPREVYADAVADRAAGIIVAHNHPSGILIPSEADLQATMRLKESGELLGIPLLDHLIITKGNFMSILASPEWYNYCNE